MCRQVPLWELPTQQGRILQRVCQLSAHVDSRLRGNDEGGGDDWRGRECRIESANDEGGEKDEEKPE